MKDEKHPEKDPESELGKKNAEIQRLKEEVDRLKQKLRSHISQQFGDEQSDKKENVNDSNANEIESEQYLFQTLMNSISDVIYFKDKGSRFIKVSQSFLMKHGLESFEQAIGKTDFDLFSEEHARQAFSDEQKIIEIGRSLSNVEEKETWNDGRVTWVSTTKMPLRDKEGNIIGTYGISRDITARKNAEEALRKNEKELYELNATKDKLFTIISHDLKNLFSSILGSSDVLIDSLKEKDFEKSYRFADIIHQSSNQSYDLLDNLLQWSRMQTGRITISPEPVVIYDVVREIIDMTKPAIDEKALEIETNIDPTLNLKVDKNIIKTVLRNLVTNAIKFTPDGGKITISAMLDEELTLYVKDTGVGIKMEDQKKIFNSSETYHTRGTNSEKGTGLGLGVCKELIEKHKGKLFLESEQGEGSTFIVTLPLI